MLQNTRREWARTIIGDSAQLDAFNRLRTSSPSSEFEYINEYNAGDLIWSTKTTGAGMYTHIPNESSVELSTGDTLAGSGVIRQTWDYFRYRPGKSLQIIMTGVLGEIEPGAVRRIGYFDGRNGVHFRQDENGVSVVVRSYVSGTAVDTIIGQADWNIDKLDGTGVSKLILHPELSQIFMIDIEWLGVGEVRYSFNVNGQTIIVHEQPHSNLLDSVYMTTANLPLRYEIVNETNTANVATMKQICSTVIVETGDDENQSFYYNGQSSGRTGKAVGADWYPIITIRGKELFNGIPQRGTIRLSDLSLFVSNVPCEYGLIYNGTLTGAAFTSVNNDSIVEYDISATGITDGIVTPLGYANAGGGKERTGLSQQTSLRYSLGLDVDGNSVNTFTLGARSLETQDSIIHGNFAWKEFY